MKYLLIHLFWAPLQMRCCYIIISFTEKKLTRGISRATDNFTLVSKARQELAEDFDSTDPNSRPSSLKLELPEHSFSLPDFSVFPESLREYLQRDLIETATLVSLEQAGMLILCVLKSRSNLSVAWGFVADKYSY